MELHMAGAVFVGITTVDLIYGLDGFPRENEKWVARSQEVHCGGPATNAAITYAFLGGTATLVSAIGTHPLCSIIRDELEQFGISLQDLAPALTEIPSVSSVLVNSRNGSRTVVSGHATRTQIPAEALDGSVLDGAALLLVDGHQMACGIRAAARAKARGIPVVLDAGSWKNSMEELLGHVQYAICSERFTPPGITSEHEIVKYLLDHGPQAVVITRGAEPITWATHDDQRQLSPPIVSAVDTTAAGDVFHGAFCYQLAKGMPFTDALAFAAEVAAFSCRFPGTRSWMDAWR
jgi:sugar/nucleoside kinase (ribokinase family)